MSKTRKIGPPSKYNDNTLIITKEYLERCIREDRIPYIGRLAQKLSITVETLSQWTSIGGKYYKAELSELVKKIKDQIEIKLQEIVTGQVKGYPIGAMFRLKSQFDYIETSKTINEDTTAQIGFLVDGKEYLPIGHKPGQPLVIVEGDTGYQPPGSIPRMVKEANAKKYQATNLVPTIKDTPKLEELPS